MEYELVIDGEMSWGDYKKIVADATPFDVRAALIEKYVKVKDGSIDNVPVRAVLNGLKKLFAEAQDPNA